MLGGIYEHSEWVAHSFVASTTTTTSTSITTMTQLANALKTIVNDASKEQKLQLLQAHPDLCQKVSTTTTLSADSQDEQAKSGLQSSLTDTEQEQFTKLNTLYKQRFGFPFILAVRNATKYTVLAALQGRVTRTREQEFQTALEQVHNIAWMRLLTKFNLQASTCQGFLTCHVLDTANGCPANNMRIQLHRLVPAESAGLVGTFVTNQDGRLEGGPALKGGQQMIVGVYEWTFYVADYFASKGTYTAGTPFLDTIPIRFGIDNPDDHYHVPLLVSPWSFSTYRGS